jgi:hypothetical protein
MPNVPVCIAMTALDLHRAVMCPHWLLCHLHQSTESSPLCSRFSPALPVPARGRGDVALAAAAGGARGDLADVFMLCDSAISLAHMPHKYARTVPCRQRR